MPCSYTLIFVFMCLHQVGAHLRVKHKAPLGEDAMARMARKQK